MSNSTVLNPHKLVLLDRDGVINVDSDAYIKSPEEWLPIPGSIESIASLYHAGISVCVVTNQSGIGRGFFSEATLHAMHVKMKKLLAQFNAEIADIFFCPHIPHDNCDCRKPNIGMLNQLEERYNISVKGVPFIGDSNKDIQLAHNKECLPILVKTGKGQDLYNKKFHSASWAKGTLVFSSLEESCHYLLTKHFVD